MRAGQSAVGIEQQVLTGRKGQNIVTGAQARRQL
jgi:hypothetical protein